MKHDENNLHNMFTNILSDKNNFLITVKIQPRIIVGANSVHGKRTANVRSKRTCTYAGTILPRDLIPIMRSERTLRKCLRGYYLRTKAKIQ